MTTVNRSLKDDHFNRIDHALGRPVDPMVESYRNYFAVYEGKTAQSFRASPHWKFNGGRFEMLSFSVTDAGRAALCEHLRQIGDKHRLYSVEWDGMQMTQVATSRGKARYQKWLGLSDAYDVPFKIFAAEARVVLA
jgi:hypothetical protein